MLKDGKLSQFTRSSPRILELEHLLQRCRKLTPNQSGTETEVQPVTQESIIFQWTIGVQLFGVWEGCRIHRRLGRSDEDRVACSYVPIPNHSRGWR